jgi:hypothetical protein
LQEESIAWDPIDRVLPWPYRVFALYLIVVVVVSLIKVVSATWQLWRLRQAVEMRSKEGSMKSLPSDTLRMAEIKSSTLWVSCFAKVQDIKKLAVFTFLVSVLMASYQISQLLREIVTLKAFGMAAV